MLTIRLITYSFISCLLLLVSAYKATAQESFQLSSNWDYTVPDGSSEKIHKIITAFDGSLIAVGETINKNKKDADGLLVIYDSKTGNRLLKQQFGGLGQDGFKSVVQNFDGTLTVVGYTTTKKQRHCWIALLDKQGKLLKEYKPLQKGYLSEEIVDVAINIEGDMMAIGNAFSEKNIVPWVLPINKTFSGEKKFLQSKELTQAMAIVATKRGDFIIVGNTFSKKRNLSAGAWARKVNATGNDQWEGAKYFGKMGFRNANDICLTSKGEGYLIVGSNNNNSAGKQDMWAMEIDEQGQVVWEKLYGGYGEDVAKGVTQLSDGGYAIVGQTKSHKPKAKSSIIKVVLIDERGTQLGEKLESIFGTKGDNIAHAVVELPDAEDIAIAASATNNNFSTPFLGTFTYQLRTAIQEVSSTALTLSDAIFKETKQDGFLAAEERGYFYFDITNTSNKRIYNVNANVVESSIQPKLSFPKTLQIGTLLPNQIKRVILPIQAKIDLQEECQLDIAFQIGGDGTIMTTALSLASDINKVISNVRASPVVKTEVISENSNDIQEEETVPLSPPPAKQVGPDYIVWAKPDASMASKVIDVHVDKVELKVIAVADAGLQKHRFALAVNGIQRRGHKMDESSLTAGTANEQGKTEIAYNTKVTLNPGLNEVQIFYLDENKESPIGKKSRKVIFNYILPDNPSLWVISIGIEHQDLAYTKKDAEDFANVYRGLQSSSGKGFKNVTVISLTQKAETGKLNILKTFKDLKHQAIKNGDLVVVFISSHGKISTDKNRFLLLPSDFDSSYEDITAVDFEEDILDPLRPVKGNKLVFVDACNSGGIGARSFTNAATSKVMSDLLDNTRGLEVFASCSSHEESYEDDSWQNGAFTKSILEAFKDVTVEIDGKQINADIYKEDQTSPNKIEAGKDGVITIRELKEYLKKRVPYLAKKVKKKAQNPLIRRDMNLDHDMGIFMVY